MLNFCDFIQVFVFTTNYHLKAYEYKNSIIFTKENNVLDFLLAFRDNPAL